MAFLLSYVTTYRQTTVFPHVECILPHKLVYKLTDHPYQLLLRIKNCLHRFTNSLRC